MPRFILTLKKIYQDHRTVIRWLIAIIVFLLLYFSIDVKSVYDKIISLKVGWVLLALAAVLVSNLFGNLSWFFVLKRLVPGMHFKKTLAAYWLGLLFNNILPTSVGGDVVKGVSVNSYVKSPLTVTFSIIVDRIIGFAILSWIGIFSYLLVFRYFPLLLLLTGFSLVLLFLVFYSSKRIYLFTYGLVKIALKGKLKRMVIRLVVYFKNVMKNGPALIRILCCMVMSQLLKVILSFFLVKGMADASSLAFPVEYVFFVVPVGGILSLISITPGGAVIREYLYSLIFKNMGNVDNLQVQVDYVPEIVVISILSHFLVVLASLPGLIFFLKKEDGNNS